MLPILPIAQMIYGGFNPSGQSKDPFISLGRSIAHGFGSGTGAQPSANPFDPYGQYAPRTPFGGYQPAGADLGSYGRGTPIPPGGDTQGIYPTSPSYNTPPPGHFAVPQAAPTMPYGSGPNYVDPRSANAFFGGLQAWNRCQANPTGGETPAYLDPGEPMPGWMAHRLAVMAAHGGGGKGGGAMPVRTQ
jgi:hypothetical protein